MYRIFVSLVFSIIVIIGNTQKIDTLVIRPSKYSTYKTEKIRKYDRTFITYQLGYYVRENNNSLSLVYEEVSKEQYENYTQRGIDFSNCKPCWQKQFNDSGILILEGLYNTDCIIGELREYYSTGSLKRIARYKRVLKNNQCNEKEGEWIYYNSNGTKQKIEKYSNDILVETKAF